MIRKKRKIAQLESEIVQEVRQSRVTFINYRKRLLNEMIEGFLDEEDVLTDYESNSVDNQENK